MRLTDHPAFARSFAAAQEAGFPLLLGPVAKSAPHNTSPYACSYERFEAEFFGTERQWDIGLALNDCLQSAAAGDVQVSAMMVGSLGRIPVSSPRALRLIMKTHAVGTMLSAPSADAQPGPRSKFASPLDYSTCSAQVSS